MASDADGQIDWTLTTWKGSRLQQHREFAALPFRRKLEIIEELTALAAKLAPPDDVKLPRVAEAPPTSDL